MPRSCIKISDTVIFGTPRSASSSHTVSHQSLLIAALTHSTFSGVCCLQAFQNMDHKRFLAIFEVFVPHFICAALTALSLKAFWIIQIVFMQECLSLMQNFMHIFCFLCSVILNVMVTQHTCPLNVIYHPHWRAQWSCHCSRMSIPVHSPWLPGYINVAQNHSHYINNSWAFSGQTSYTFSHVTVLYLNHCCLILKHAYFCLSFPKTQITEKSENSKN